MDVKIVRQKNARRLWEILQNKRGPMEGLKVVYISTSKKWMNVKQPCFFKIMGVALHP